MTLAEYLRGELAGVADTDTKAIALTGDVWRQIIEVLETEDVFAEQDDWCFARLQLAEAEWNDPAAVEQQRVERRAKQKAYVARRKARGLAG